MEPTTTEIMTITPEIAQRWLNEYAYEGQRRIDQRQVDNYALQMIDGTFTLSTFDIRVLESRNYLLNGYTRLHAVIRAESPIEANVVIKPVRSREELSQHYSHFDQHRKRTQHVVLRGYDLTEETGITTALQDRVATCATILIPGFQGTGQAHYLRSYDVRVRLLKDWAPYAKAAVDAMGISSSTRIEKAVQRLLSSPYFSVIMVTFKYQPEKAASFWRQIVDDDALRAKSPQKAIRKMMVEPSGRGKLDYPLTTRRIAAAWNAYMEGRDIEILKAIARKGAKGNQRYDPIKILGTPYDGRTVNYLYGYRDRPLEEAADAE